jgi:hypothetical protein
LTITNVTPTNNGDYVVVVTNGYGSVTSTPPANLTVSSSVISHGLAWLVSQQNSNGSWGSSYPVAYTGFAIAKLEDRAFELGYASPFDDAYPYKTNVINGLNYLFNQVSTNARTGGFCFVPGSGAETYCTGIGMLGIAASRAPTNIVNVANSLVNGMTYKAVLQSIVNYFAAGQNPDGGWRYSALSGSSDNSNTGYAVMGLRFAESPIYGFACVIPAKLKAALSTNWIKAIQDNSGDSNDGGGGYTSGSSGVNLLETGNLLFEMSFVGDNTSIQRVQRAIAYIQTKWNENDENPGWRPHQYQAMDCLMEGFGSLGITNITVNGTNVDWFGQFSDAIVVSQQSNGAWPADGNGDAMLSTEWALLVLEKVSGGEPLQIIPLDFDATGCVGGPFTVTNETFSLINTGTGTNSLTWSLANTSTWLDASPGGGTLTVGAWTNVTVSLNSNAYSLPSGFYTATVWFTNLNDSAVQSRQFTLAIDLLTILFQPQSLIVSKWFPASFSVSVSGTPPLNFQWQKNGTNLADGNNISGSTTATLVLNPTTINDAGNYTVIITNACGSVVTSSNAILIFIPSSTQLTNLLGNPGFELPNIGKYTNFDVGGPTPFWNDDGVNYVNTGVENTGAHGGNYRAFEMAADDGAYQISTNPVPLHLGDQVILTWWALGDTSSDSQGTNLTDPMAIVGIITATNYNSYLLGGGNDLFTDTTAVLIASNGIPSVWTPYALTYTAQASDVGKYPGVFFNTGEGEGVNTTNCFAAYDDFALYVQPATVILTNRWNGSTLTLSWPQGTLLQATNLLGPWVTNGATEPFSVQPMTNGPVMFYRVRVQ